MKLREGLKVLSKKTVISMIIAIILLVSLFTAVIFVQSEKYMVIKNSKQELKRAMNYERFEEGDENVEETPNVQFSAFFLRDLNGDGYAEKIKGTCKEIGTDDTLYMEINVLTDGYLKDAKVDIEGKNFYLQTALPKDNEFKNNYISDSTKTIEFNNIVNGTQKLFSGVVRSGNYSYSSTKTAAIGNNIANYSRNDNNIVFSGTYVSSEGVETKIVKIVPLIVDWYGVTNATITSVNQNSYDLNTRANEENDSLVLDFTVSVNENRNQLILSKNYVEGEIPELNGFAPKYVGLENSQGLSFNYDKETRKFTIEKNATNIDGMITKTVARSSSYKLQVVYPYEAYEENFGDTITIRIPVKTYFEGYNNPNTEFESPYISNTARATVIARFEKELQEDSRVEIQVGSYETIPERRYMISKQKLLNIYNGIVEEEHNDRYEVRWNVYISSKDENKKLTLMENKKDAEVLVTDNFIKVDSSEVSMEEVVSNVGIYFVNANDILKEDGFIKVFDVETNNLLVTFTKDNWDNYSEKNPYYYEFPVKHVKIETSETKKEVNFEVVNIKEIDDDKLTKIYDRREFDEFVYIKSILEVYINENFVCTKMNFAKYEEKYSIASLSISKDILSTQVTEKNIKLTVSGEYNNQNNQIGWVNGAFLLKFPEEIIDIKINEIKIVGSNVIIDTYELIENSNNKFIKINTKNIIENEEPISIALDLDISPDPRCSTVSKPIELFAYNERNNNYFYDAQDIYDINNNLDIDEKVARVEKILNLVAPNTLLTNQTASEFDEENTIVVSPQIADISNKVADVETSSKTAKIGVQIKNNYTNTISEVVILGRIPFKDNSTVLTNIDLNSEFTTIMLEEGILVPEELKDRVKVYYSENPIATNDLLLEENGWILKNDITNFENIKSYLIDFKESILDVGKEYVFYYKVNLPKDIEINKVSYSHHGVYFALDTDEGKYRTQTEPNELGLRIAEKYDLEIVKYQTGKEKIIPGATYVLREIDADGNIISTKTGVTNGEGKIYINKLYKGITYEIKELKSPEDYELNDEIIRFTTFSDENGNIIPEKLQGETKEDLTIEVDENNKTKLILKVEDEAKAKLKIIKKEKGKDIPVAYAKFKVYGNNLPETGKIITTNKDGESILSGFKVNEEYTLVEIKAEGYYLGEQIKFKLVNNYGIYEVEVTDGEVYSSSVIEEDSLPIINLVIENEKISTYDLEITKVKRVLETELKEIGEENYSEESEPIYLVGAKFKLYANQDDIGTYETDENGKFYITNLYEYQEGINEVIYTLKEIVAPDGYSKIKDIKFKIQNINGTLTFVNIEGKEEKYTVQDDIIKLTIEDSPIFKLIKKDAETGETLAGIKFAFYNIDEIEMPAINSKGDIVGEKQIINGKEYYILETDRKGEIFVDLPEGLYKAVEVQTPEKYDLTKNEYYFGIGKSRYNGQEIITKWGNTIYSVDTSHPGLEAVRPTEDGGCIVAGTTEGETFLPNNIVMGDRKGEAVIVIKYDEFGQVEWYNSIKSKGQYNYMVATDIEVLENGDYVVTGNHNGRGFSVDGNSITNNDSTKYLNLYRGFFVRFNSNGEFLFGKMLETESGVTSVVATEDGGYIVGGNFKDKCDVAFNEYIESVSGLDGFVIKYNNDDSFDWKKQISGQGGESISVLKKNNNNNNYIVGGYSGSEELKIDNLDSITLHSSNDVFFMEMDIDGNVNFVETLKGDSTDSIHDVIATSDNGYMLVAQTTSKVIELSNGNNINLNVSSAEILIKYDRDNNIQWSKVIELGSSQATVVSVVESKNNGYMLLFYLDGSINLDNGETFSCRQGGLLIKLDFNGNTIFGKTLKGNSTIKAIDMEINNNGEYFVVGCIFGGKLVVDSNCTLSGAAGYLIKFSSEIEKKEITKIEYKQKIAGTLNENINKIANTSNNGYLVVGDFESTNINLDNIVLKNNGRTDAFIIKYNLNNQIEWAKSIGGTSFDAFNSVVELEDGDIIAIGTFGSSEFYIDDIKCTKENPSYDTIIVRLDSSGNFKNYSVHTGRINDEAVSVQKTKDSGYIVAGVFRSETLKIGEYVLENPEQKADSYIVKYSKNDEIEFIKHIHEDNEELINSIKIDSKGNIVCVGSLNGNKFFDKVASTNKDGYIVIYDEKGNMIFNDVFMLDESVEIKDIISVNEGYIIIANTSYNGYIYTVKLNGDKKIVDEKHEIPNSKIREILLTKDGGYNLIGTFRSPAWNYIYTFPNGYSIENSCDFIIKYDLNHEMKWIKTFEDSGNKVINSVVEVNENRYKVGFNFSGVVSIDKNKNNLISSVGKNDGVILDFVEQFSAIEETNLIVGNKRKEFRISTSINEIDGIKGGSISGEDKRVFEIVKYGDESTKEIKIVSDENYEITEIKVNGEDFRFDLEEDGSYVMPVFTNVTKDILVEVTFALQTNKITINKVDSETKDGLGKVEFDIQQIEERNELNDEIGNIEENSGEYFEINFDALENGSKGTLIDNGDVYGGTVDKTIELNDVLGSLTNNGKYYFTNVDGKYISNNKGVNNGIAYSYIKVDLSNYTGNYIVTVNASVSSESNYDIGFARITNSTTALGYTDTTGRFMYISGNIASKDYNSLVLTGGNVYYLHLGYRKDASANSNNDEVVINSVKVHPVLDGIQYNFEEVDGKYVSTNQGLGSSVSNSYIPIDLRDKEGTYAVIVNASISSQSNGDYGYATITEGTTKPAYNSSTGRFVYISGITLSKDYQSEWLEGGKLYYLHLGYYKNSSTDTGDDRFTINSVNVYKANGVSYEFVENDGVYISNNQGKNNTTANSYIPIDMTNLTGDYNVIVEAEISSESNKDYGYVTITENITRPAYNNTKGRFIYVSGISESNEFVSNKISGGKIYYLHFGYYKGASGNTGEDAFKINSVRVVPNEEHLYNTRVTTNSWGKAITQIPYGKYMVTEINAPEGYEPLDSSVIIEFRENGEKEFTIENRKLAKVIVHHYKAEVDKSRNGYVYTEEKLAEDEVFMDKTGYPYKTSPKMDLGKYSLITNPLGEYILPENATGQYNGVIEVNYYYSEGKIPLRVQHIIEGTEDRVELNNGEKVKDDILYGKEGQEYETIPIPKENLHEKYEVVGSTDNTSGKYEYSDIVVNYYYKVKEFDVTTKVEPKVQTDLFGNESIVAGGTILGEDEKIYETVLYGENSTKDIIATPDEGYYVESLTINEEPVEFTPDENGVVRLANFSNMKEDKMVLVGFAKDKGKVTVHHKLVGTDEYVPSVEEGILVEPEIKEGDIGAAFATKPSNLVAKRYVVVSNTEPSSGLYSIDDQEVTYYYDLNNFDYKIEYYYNDMLDEEKTENGIVRWGTVVDTYTEKLEYGYELDKIENYPLTVSENVENNVIKVHYKPMDSSINVKYVDKYTEEEIAEEKVISGKVFEKHNLTEDIIEIDGYTFLEIQEPTEVEFDVDEKEYIIYYVKNTKVIVNYKDISDDSIIETIEIPGVEGAEYETYAKDFENYVLEQKPEIETGIMTREEIIIDYYYRYVSEGVIEKHIDVRTNKLLDSKYYTGMEGDLYTTDKKEFIGYDILTNIQYYKEFIKEQFTEDEILELLEKYEVETEEELFEKYTDELVLNVLKENNLNSDDEYIPSNKDGIMTKGVIEIKYYYVRKTKVKVEYIDKQTGKPIIIETKVDTNKDDVTDSFVLTEAVEVIEGHEGDEYETRAKEFEEYVLLKDEEGKDIIPENSKGIMTKEDILVRYEYAKKTKVIEKHIDIKTGMLLEPEKIYEGYVGKEYEILSKEFEGYVLVEENIPEKSKGEMTKEIIIVEYYYIHKGKVIVEYIDKYSGEILKDKVEADINEDGIIDDGEFEEKDSTIIIEGLEGDEYKTSANEFDNYKLVENEIPLNKEGFMIKDEIKVTYKYVHKSIGVKEEHRDAITGELLEDVIIHEGYEGDVYNVLDKEINNYDLDESRKPNNSSGKMTKEEIVVTYYYVRKTEVIVQYLNEETEESLSEEKVIKGHVGDNYKTEPKNIEGYRVSKYTTNHEGIMENNVIVVRYYYVKDEVVIPEEKPEEKPEEVPETKPEDTDHIIITENKVTVNNKVVEVVNTTNSTNTTNTANKVSNTLIANTIKNEVSNKVNNKIDNTINTYDKDESQKIPETGDSAPIIAIVGLMIVVLVNAIYVITNNNKNNNKNKKNKQMKKK